MPVNENLMDLIIAHQIFLLRFSESHRKKILALFSQADADLTRQLRDRLDRLGPIDRQVFGRGLATTRRTLALRDMIRELNSQLTGDLQKNLRDTLRDLASVEVKVADRIFDQAIGLTLNNPLPAPALVAAVVTSEPFRGQVLREWVKDLSRKRLFDITTAIQLGIVEGQTNEEIIRRLRGTDARGRLDGALSISHRRAEVLVRTAINFIGNAARQKFYEENSDLIDELRWTSTLDSKTSAICQARDKLVFPIDSGPRPPAHPNCRSLMVPVLKSWEDILGSGLKPGRGSTDIDRLFRQQLRKRGLNPAGIERNTRSASGDFDGQVPKSLSYQDWLRRQSAGFQNTVLGPTKGKAFRNGEFELDQFVNMETGREFTLNELGLAP